MTFSIRKATKKDMPRVLELIVELAVYEKEPDAVDITVEDLIRNGFEDPKQFTCFVAECNDCIEGIALVYHRFSTWKGRVLHLEDLIVSQHMRGSGIGSALLKTVVDYGIETEVKRVSWEVLDWNTSAISFYENKGATIKKDWYLVQLDDTAMKQFKANN